MGVGTPFRPPWWVPNALTLLRLAIAGYFPFAAAGWRLPLVLVAATSDWADGAIARRFKLTSWVGSLMDGIADKAVTLSVLATFAHEGVMAWWHLGLVLTRDVTVGVIAAYTALRREWAQFKSMTARWPGKLTTAGVFVLMGVLLVAPAYAPWALWPTIALSVIAGIDYFMQFRRANRALRRRPRLGPRLGPEDSPDSPRVRP